MIAEPAKRHGIKRNVAQKPRALANLDIGYTKSKLSKWFRKYRNSRITENVRSSIPAFRMLFINSSKPADDAARIRYVP